MCGRFAAGNLTQQQMLDIVEGFLSPLRLDPDAPPPVTGYNIKPTNQISCLLAQDGQASLSTARWWFVPHWAKGTWKQTTFNARIETAYEKPSFRTAWAHHRCVIPATGYFEWTGPKGSKQPWYISAQTNHPMLFLAGLYSWRPDLGYTATILTRATLPQLSDLHHRVPVFLDPHALGPWIDGTIGTRDAMELGSAFEGRMRYHKVRPITRDADGPEVIEPFE